MTLNTNKLDPLQNWNFIEIEKRGTRASQFPKDEQSVQPVTIPGLNASISA